MVSFHNCFPTARSKGWPKGAKSSVRPIFRKAVSALLVSGSLAACGGQTAQGPLVATSAPVASPGVSMPVDQPSTSTSAPSVQTGWAGSGILKNADGYAVAATFNADVNVPFIPNPSSEKPGKTSLTGQIDFSITVENSTPGRAVLFGSHSFGTSPGDHLSGPFVLEGVFPAGDPVCSLISNSGQIVPEGGSGRLLSPKNLSGGCEFVYSYAMVGGDGSYPGKSAQLAPDASKKLTSFGAIFPLAGHENQYAQNVKALTGPFVLGAVPEATAEAVIRSLQRPKALIIGYLSWLGQPGSASGANPDCTIVASSDPAYKC